MKVIASYKFEFLPDTSDMDEKFIDKKGIAEELTENELQNLLDNNEISAKDFDYKVEDDGNDHKIAECPIYIIDPYKAASPIMIDFVKQSSDLVKERSGDYKEDFVRALVEAVNSDLSWTILGRDIFN